jgi:hypothetical protein
MASRKSRKKQAARAAAQAAGPAKGAGWVRRWLETSKPTEWITAFGAALGVLATITAAAFVVGNGLFDAKKSELEIKRSELSIQNAKLEIQQRDLIAQREKVTEQIAAKERMLRQTEGELADARQAVAAYERHEKALAFLSAHSPTGQMERRTRADALECTLKIDPTLALCSVQIRGGTEGAPVRSPEKDGFLAAVANVIGLNHLNIENVQLDAQDLRIISGLPRLRNLGLTNCGLTDQEVRALALDQNVNCISLDRNPITRLPVIRHPWAIQVLSVSDTRVGDDELVPLLPHAINLYALNLEGAAVTDRTLAALCRGNVVVNNVRVVDTRVSVAGVKDLVARVPTRWVFMGLFEAEKDELDKYLKGRNIPSCIVMSNRRLDDQREGRKSVIVGKITNSHQVRDGGMIRANVGEIITIHADEEIFKKKGYSGRVFG